MSFWKIDLKNPLIPLCFVILIDHIGMGIIFPILVPIFMESNGILGAGIAESTQSFWYNVTLSIYPIFAFFGAAILGSLSDQFGRKKVLVFCLLGSALGYFLSGFAIDIQNIPLLIFSRALAGLTAGSFPVAQAAVIDISTEDNKASNIGLILLSASIGFLVGPLLGSFCSNSNILDWFYYSTPLYCASILALINIVLLRVFKETFVPKAPLKKNVFKKSIELLLAPIQLKHIRYLSLIFLFMQFGWGFYFQFISVYLLKKHDFSSQDIGYFMSFMGVGFALGSCWILRILSKYFRDVSLAIGILITVMFTMFMTIIELPWFIILGASVLLGCTWAVAYSILIKLFSSLVSEEEQGFIMGVAESLVFVAFAITPMLNTYLESLDISIPLIVAILSVGIGSVLLFRWKSVKQTRIALGQTH